METVDRRLSNATPVKKKLIFWVEQDSNHQIETFRNKAIRTMFYLLRLKGSFPGLGPASDEGWKVLDSFNGINSFEKSWIPLKVLIADDYQVDRPLADTDFPTTGLLNVLAMSGRAKNALEDLLYDYAEILPLSGDGDGYWVCNVTTVMNFVDIERSSIVYFPSSSERIMDIDTYVFKSDASTDSPIFKVPEMGGFDIFVTDVFKKRVEDRGLRGLRFDPIST